MHSYLGHEGLPPSEFAAIGREEVRSYGGEVVPGRAIDVTPLPDNAGFAVQLAGGTTLIARRVLAATGLVDELPDIEGLAQHWGTDVLVCPFCHGYEVRDQRIVQIITHPMGLHPARLFRHLSEQFTLVLHSDVAVDDAEVNALRAGGVRVIDERVRRVITGADGHLSGIELIDGSTLDADAVVVTTRFVAQVQPFASLGLKATSHPIGVGDFVETDMTGATAVPGLFAAGNLTDPSHQVLQAAAHGSRVGGMISFSLAEEDLEASSRQSANQVDWDHRYSGDQMWSGNPNGTLVNQVSDLRAGRALDVGAGEGGDAIWLAGQGWDVTASDISEVALERIASAAKERNLTVQCLSADANAPDPYHGETFDLVSAQYASIPRTPDGRAMHNLLNAVAPGGTLLVVSHDLEPMRAAIDTHENSRAFDPDAYLRVEDFVAALVGSEDWEIQVHDKRERPSGAASASHHVDDVVLRAQRHAG